MSARPVDFAPTALPRTIGKYIVSHVIGEGSMGVVYKAVDPQIQRSVAIKTIRRPALLAETGDGGAAQRFRQEAQAAGRLNHPNIVSIYEYGESDDGSGQTQLFIVMECVEGQSLHELLAVGMRLSVPDVVAVMLQVLDALHCAHEQRVWHCDIKPGNLLVTRDGRVKVTDFGIARIDSADLQLRNAIYGSPGYMAPELYAGGAPDQRVDLFSCGVLLYQLLADTMPFKGSANDVMYQVLRQEPLPPSQVRPGQAPRALDAVVARALAKRPADRYANALEMREALLAVLPATATVPRVLSPAGLADMQGAGTATQLVVLPEPASRPPGAATWDPRALAHIEALLRPHLGAVSKYAVREMARRSSSVSALVSKLAAASLKPEERGSFIAQAARLTGIPRETPTLVLSRDETAAALPAPAAEPADLPLLPEAVEQAGRLLAQQIGPIALLHARRAAATASGRDAFFRALADRAGEGVDREVLLKRLRRLP